MKAITLYPHEIRRLQAAGSVTVWRPIEPTVAIRKPTDFRWLDHMPHPEVYGAGGVWLPIKVPHPPGSERWVREGWGWAVTPKAKSVIVYRADDQARHVLCDNEGEGDYVGVAKKAVEYVTVLGEVRWKPPATMPRWASRLTVQVAGVEARQVQTIEHDEAKSAGIEGGQGPGCSFALFGFRDWWQSRYGHWNPDEWAWATTLERKEG